MAVFASFNPTALRAGDFPMISRPVTLKVGSNASGTPLPRGAVLGALTTASGSAVAGSTNTGNGTLTPDASTPILTGAQEGAYTVTFTSPTAYSVTDPTLEKVVVGTGVVGTAFATQIKFNIAAGGTAFVAGDSFTYYAELAGQGYTLSALAASNGSQTPRCILAADADASANDVIVPAYFTGEFADLMMTFGAGHTQATVDAAFAAAGQPIFIRKVGAVA
jgi:hypothetical protein